MLIKLLTAFTFIAMVVVNGLANSLPINGRGTGEISDAYANLFAPAGVTFAIWGVIYFLLAGYVLYQFLPIKSKSQPKIEELCKKINPLFIATSLANIAWIFSWHYDFIVVSLLLMVTLLVLLIKIADLLTKARLSGRESYFISLPFTVYFGWITVATIANVTIFLVSLGWRGWIVPDYIWTSLILLVGAVIGILRMRLDKRFAYGAVLVWAYSGILFKHLSADGFAGQYPSIILTVVLCLGLFIFWIGKLFLQNKKAKTDQQKTAPAKS